LGITFNNEFSKLFIRGRNETVLVYRCKWRNFIFGEHDGIDKS
jgi:hypothetical protein